MNRRTLEQYFPALRKYASRLGNWRRSDMTRRSRYSRRHLEVRKCVVRAPIPEVAGIKILFVSDLHWFDSPENRQALEALEAAAEEIAPDYLALGGDITEDADHIRELPEVLTRLRNQDAQLLTDLEHKYKHELSFRADPALHCEEFILVDPETGAEVK